MQNTPIFEENGPENFKGIDIMRAVRSFDPCLPCGVHMYTGGGKVRKVLHTPTGHVLSGADERAAAGPPPEELVERVQRLTAELEAIADPLARGTAEELVGAVIELYGEGLERIFDALDERRARRRAVRERAGRRRRRRQPDADPRPLPGRRSSSGWWRRSTACGPTWSRTAATSSCSASSDGVARIRLEGSCDGCPASSATLELAIKQALDEAAPDLEGLEVEGDRGAAADAGRSAASSCRSCRAAPAPTATATAPTEGSRRRSSEPALVVGAAELADLEDGSLTDARGRRQRR